MDDGSFVLAEPYRGLLRLTAPDVEPEVLTRLEGEDVTHQFAQMLPDGKTILFSVGQGHFHSTRIEVLAAAAGTVERKVVLEDAYSATYVASGHLVFGRGDAILVAPFDLESLSVVAFMTQLCGVPTVASWYSIRPATATLTSIGRRQVGQAPPLA